MKKVFCFLVLLFLSCVREPESERPEKHENVDKLAAIGRGGWVMSEVDASIPVDVSGGFGAGFGSITYPEEVILENYFPPIRNQSPYNNCVAWAVGYNLKTALNAIENNLQPAELRNPNNQTSPKDLWFAIPESKRGAGANRYVECDIATTCKCHYTYFDDAFNALVVTGAASEFSVPSDGDNWNCNGKPVGSASNKIRNNEQRTNYIRKISPITEQNLKAELYSKNPLAIGAYIYKNFERWNDSSVYNKFEDSLDGQHAMVLVGYSDKKHAFRVRNSWGDGWGDKGSIWVDYEFFKSFIANGAVYSIKNIEPVENTNKSGYNLEVSGVMDSAAAPNSRERLFSYEIVNTGTEKISASQKWSVLYLYYNAGDAHDNGVIFEHYFTDEYGSLGKYGKYTNTEALSGMWSNFDIDVGKRFPGDYFSDKFLISYTMPQITGDYYLVVFANTYDTIDEFNKEDNFYFLTALNGVPLRFENGVLKNIPNNNISLSSKVLAKRDAGASVNARSVQALGGNPNAYTPREIMALVKKYFKKP